MSEMPFEEEHMDVLQNIEASIHAVHLQNPELTDYEVDSALEALQRTYQRESIGKPATLPRNPRSAEVYEAARAACEIRLGRAPITEKYKKNRRNRDSPCAPRNHPQSAKAHPQIRGLLDQTKRPPGLPGLH